MRSLTLTAVLALAASAQSQTPAAQSVTPPVLPPVPAAAIASHPDWPAAKPEDVSTPDAIIRALSDSISGPAGQPRDWNRFRSLFVPGGGRLVVIREAHPNAPTNKEADVIVLTPDDYIARNTAATQSVGIFEEPLVSRGESFGEMTHVYSSYQLKHAKDDPTPIARGVNSYELLRSANRYYILQVYWTVERVANPIPSTLEPAAK